MQQPLNPEIVELPEECSKMSGEGVEKTMEGGIITEKMRDELGGNPRRGAEKQTGKHLARPQSESRWVLSKLCEQARTCPSWMKPSVSGGGERAHGNWVTSCAAFAHTGRPLPLLTAHGGPVRTATYTDD